MNAQAIVCYLGLGANLGRAVNTLCAAADAIAALPGCAELRRSSLYRSAPQETRTAQPDYYNAAITFTTTRSARSLWRDMHAIERRLGRTRGDERNAARTIDIDFLLYGDKEIASEDLLLPHPRIAQRAFVLLPLVELDPTIAIPGLGPARGYLDQVKTQRIDRIESKEWSACN
jgi:2-amino-4-hydroxy-6-hydroxymethyldihydropteridine diphosphokinase